VAKAKINGNVRGAGSSFAALHTMQPVVNSQAIRIISNLPDFAMSFAPSSSEDGKED
jgi:hypothetical protein